MSREQPSRRDATLRRRCSCRLLPAACCLLPAACSVASRRFCGKYIFSILSADTSGCCTRCGNECCNNKDASTGCMPLLLTLSPPLFPFVCFSFSVFAFYLWLYWPCPIVCCSPFAISCSCSSVFPAAFAAAFYDDFVACYATWAHAKFQNYISLLKFN